MPTKERTKMQAREAIAIVVGARPPVYEKRIVRNNRTGKLAEIEMNPELPPVDSGDLGRTYVFKQGEVVWSDYEAVIDCPSAFVEAVES
jgi:hypothetical protein